MKEDRLMNKQGIAAQPLEEDRLIFVYFGRESVVLSFWGDPFILEFSKSLISIHSE